jgi:hypothetical protein
VGAAAVGMPPIIIKRRRVLARRVTPIDIPEGERMKDEEVSEAETLVPGEGGDDEDEDDDEEGKDDDEEEE